MVEQRFDKIRALCYTPAILLKNRAYMLNLSVEVLKIVMHL